MTLFTPAADTAVVTGGAGDIGGAITAGLAELGCQVVVLDINPQRVDQVVARLADAGLKVAGYAADLSDGDEVRRLHRSVEEHHGPVGILVNAIGIVSSTKFLDIGTDEWERVMKVNLQSIYGICRTFVPSMSELGSGRIVNLSSAAGKTGGGLLGTAAYVASKAGVIGFTKALARELAPRSITCNAIAPGPIDTSMTSIYREQPELRAAVEASLPLRRIGRPTEIADVVTYLASTQAAYITGETFDVDGGLIME